MDESLKQNPLRQLTLALLCGGQSSRLGSDKGLYRPTGDESLARRAMRIFSPHVQELLIVVRDEEQETRYRDDLHPETWDNIRIVSDAAAGTEGDGSALAGIATALQCAHSEHVIVLPIDQVGVSVSHLLRLVAESTGARSAHFSSDAGDLPFPALFSTVQTETVNAALAAGQYRIMGFHADAGSRIIPAKDLAPSLQINCNTTTEMESFFGRALHDPFKRRLHYLRFSLTEACNLSCTYCLPDGFPEWLRHKATLDLDAIKNLLTGFRRLGFRKVRFTGGEPTVHPKCLDAVRIARDLGFESIALTTNGLLIKNLSQWRDAGLSLLNVSLDSHDDEEFFKITKSRGAAKVRALVDEACASGLEVKTNAVLMRSVNGHEKTITDMIDWAITRPMTLRFIELMNTGLNSSFAASERVLGSEIVPYLEMRGYALITPDKHKVSMAGPATDYFSSRYPGKVGLINPLSCNFCDRCNRLRITAKGALKMCLFGHNDVLLDTRAPETVEHAIRLAVEKKPERHHLEDGDTGNVQTFRTIGG